MLGAKMNKSTYKTAFPCTAMSSQQQGMLLLDWFAGQVIGHLVEVDWILDIDQADKGLANMAYDVAEAMLAEREKRMQKTMQNKTQN
jgi:hypothetical protein